METEPTMYSNVWPVIGDTWPQTKENVKRKLRSWLNIDECMVLDHMQLLLTYDCKDTWIAQTNHDRYFDFDDILYVFNEEDTWACNEQRERAQLAMLNGLSHGRWNAKKQDYIYHLNLHW